MGIAVCCAVAVCCLCWCYAFTVSLANFSSSCFVPAFSNSTVAFVLSPLPSILRTIPLPKRSCITLVPTVMFPPVPAVDVCGEGDGGVVAWCGASFIAVFSLRRLLGRGVL